MVLVEFRFVQRDKAAGSCIHDVVLENIVRHIPLHLELTRTGCRRIVFVKSVVDHRAVLGVSSLRVIASDGNTRSMGVIDKIIACRDVAGGAVLVLAGQFDSEVHIMHDVLLDQDPGAAVHVNAVGVFFIAVRRIAFRSNVVNQIAAHHSVAGLVDRWIGRRALETDHVDSNVVVVVDDIVGDAEVRDVPVHYQRFAGTSLEVMHLVAVNDQVRDGSFGVGAVHRNAKSVGAMSRTVAAFKSLLNVMHIIVQQFDMGAGPHNAYPQRRQAMFGGVEVANFKSFDPYITLIVNGQYGLPSGGSEMRCVEHRRFAWVASQSDESFTRVPGCVDAHQLFVNSPAHVDGTTCPRCIRGMLNRAPGGGLGTGIRIISRHRHIIRGVDLRKSAGDAHK